MTTFLLAAAVLVAKYDMEPPMVDVVKTMTWKKAGAVAVRLKGRVLGSLICEGMPIDQVERILGENPGVIVPTFTTRNGTHAWLEYNKLGVTVIFWRKSNDEGWLRMDKITFWSIFD